MHPRLSRAIVEIHRAARAAPANRFKDGALAIARRALDFDSALWAEAPPAANLTANNPIHLLNQPWEMMESYFRIVGAADPLIDLAVQAPGATFNLLENFPREEWEATEAYQDHGRPFGLEGTLCTATPHPEVGLNSYISLYRSRPQSAFSESDRQAKELLTPHLIEAYRTVLLREAADTRLRPREDRGFALVDRAGLLLHRTPSFPGILRATFPEWRGPYLPEALRLGILPAGETSLGPLRAEARPRASGFSIVALEDMSPLHRLTPAERRVAHLIATGSSYKGAARALGRSPSTVGNQVSRIYAKLGLRDKASLIRLIGDTRHRSAEEALHG